MSYKSIRSLVAFFDWDQKKTRSSKRSGQAREAAFAGRYTSLYIGNLSLAIHRQEVHVCLQPVAIENTSNKHDESYVMLP